VDIPSYLSRIREGDLREAAKMLLDVNPLPSITGRVCPHFCEQECNRGELDESVSIRDIERFIGDFILENKKEIIKIRGTAKKKTGKKVAIVGSGPAGLTAAYYLARSGHSITVFEESSEPGGMMRTGIPDFRLPTDILDAEIDKIRKAGVDIKVNTRVQSIQSLFRQGYVAVFLALGASRSAKMGIQGEQFPGVMDGMSFLRAANVGEKVSLGEKVAVIGGGNTAIDSGRAALRLGAREATVIYRRTRAEMPAGRDEIEEALQEGVEIIFLAAPVKISRIEGRLKLTCTRMELGEPDASGRRKPVPMKDSEFSMDFDSVIAAVGQVPDIPSQLGLKARRDRTLGVDFNTQATDRRGAWAGGDVVTGPATVIAAIAAGKRAAVSIDSYLKGGAEAEEKDKATLQPFLRFSKKCLERTSKAKMPKLSVSERRINVEDALGLGLKEVETEANRCFNCSCVGVNASDIAVVLMALDAKVKIAGRGGVRTIPISDFFGSLGNVLEADEILTEIQVPKPPERSKQTFLKFRLRESIDFAVVSVASVITRSNGVCEGARIALGAVAPRPIRVKEAEQTLQGKPINLASAEAASEAAVTGVLPLGMNEYKVEITKTLVKRAILA
jgi:NADPH-dependent glutamate synthase beta subunit-like oxidoreductase